MDRIANADLASLSRDLRALGARPRWESTKGISARSSATPFLWRYRDMRPRLLRSIDLISAEEAERRVFMLENPGLPGTNYVTNSLFCGLQAIRPGEIAPAHRHSSNALRFIIESEGAYSSVGGELVFMHPGDLILTPGWAWHDHGNLGTAPAIWLDSLDHPFGNFFGTIFREDCPEGAGPAPQAQDVNAARYGANLLPDEYRPQHRSSPLLAYRYDRTREALDHLTRHGPLHPAHGMKMRYANPANGGHIYPTIAAFIQLLPKGFSGETVRGTDSQVFVVMEGSGRARVGEIELEFEAHDVFVVPPWTRYSLTAHGECVLFSYSDRAAQEALGFWREESAARKA